MSLDPELKVLLSALATGQVGLAETTKELAASNTRLEKSMKRLADGQVRHDERLGRLEAAAERLFEGQARHDQRLDRLEETVAHLAAATEASLDGLSEKMGELGDHLAGVGDQVKTFTQAVREGFTNGADRDRRLEDQVRSLEVRVTRLEQLPTPS